MKTKYILLIIFCLVFGYKPCCSQDKLQFEEKLIRFGIEVNPNFNITVSLDFDYPIVQQNTDLLNICEEILSEIFEFPTDSIITDSIILLEHFFGISELEEIDWYSDTDIKMNYEKSVNGKVLFTDDNILSYRISSYIYSGGAHGYSHLTYFVFDLKTGKRLTEEDIFTENYQEIITEIMLNKLNVSNNNSLDDYYLDNIKPNSNFFVDEKGITYFFNSYEIACYAFGPTEIFISYQEIQSILKKKII